jgi:UDP-glucose 4-epimerase
MNFDKKILVVGGAGYIGSATVKSLFENGYKNIVVFDNLDKGRIELVDKMAVFVQGDLRNKEGLNQLFSNHDFDCVIHFAALKAVFESEEFPEKYFENNVCGTANLLATMDAFDVKQIIFSSTACVYAEKDSGVYVESDPLCAPNVYGSTKIICENMIRDYNRTKNLNYTIFRYFNVAGDVGLNYVDPDAQNIFPIISEVITGKREKLQIFGNNYKTRDGTCVRDYIHLKDLVSAHVLAVESTESLEFNLGTEKGTSVQELVDSFIRLNGKFNYVVSSKRGGDLGVSLADSSLAKEKLGWQAEIDLDVMIADTLEVYYKK